MEEKSKGFSLRQKKSSRRPPISGPKQISSTSNNGPTSQGRGNDIYTNSSTRGTAQKRHTKERPRLGGGTSDLVKRRYSTRFTNVPDFSSSDKPPPVPAIHEQQRLLKNLSQNIEVDVKALRDSSLDAEKYSRSILSDASDQELREYQASLRKMKNRTSTDLQQNVYQNRTQFIKISKEADKLKGEMRVLRSLMSELASTLNQASMSLSNPEARTTSDDDGVRARKQANRSSVANLEAMWNVQLQALWKNVEGSQKFLPAILGRHVIHESGYWVELDAATWKARRPAHIFLLNDHLLVATLKKKRTDPNVPINGNASQKPTTKLIADRCWPLQGIDMIDITSTSLNDRNEMSNAISIRHGHESFTYRFDKSSGVEKADLLLAFRRAADELRKASRADMDDSDTKAKESMDYVACDPTIYREPALIRSISSGKNRPEVLIEVDGKHQNLRWVEGQIDELDSEVALQRFEDAVRRIEKLQRISRGLKGNSIAQAIIVTKVDERAMKLANLVMQQLVDTHSYLKATQTNIAWLVRLGYDDSARKAFLNARTNIITKRNRQILFEGNLHHHIFQISFVYFTLMRNTVSIYQQCFPPVMMSSCVNWAKEHLDDFNKTLANQLSNVQRDSPTWKECIDRAREHAKMMDEVGLDFKNLVGIGLRDDAGGISSNQASNI